MRRFMPLSRRRDIATDIVRRSYARGIYTTDIGLTSSAFDRLDAVQLSSVHTTRVHGP